MHRQALSARPRPRRFTALAGVAFHRLNGPGLLLLPILAGAAAQGVAAALCGAEAHQPAATIVLGLLPWLAILARIGEAPLLLDRAMQLRAETLLLAVAAWGVLAGVLKMPGCAAPPPADGLAAMLLGQLCVSGCTMGALGCLRRHVYYRRGRGRRA
jgi:hypothetical protein